MIVQTDAVGKDAVDPLASDVIETGLSGVESARRALADAKQRRPAAPPPAPPALPQTGAPSSPRTPGSADIDQAGDARDTLTSDGALLQMVQGQLREQLERALTERDARIARLEMENGSLREELAVVAEAVGRAMRNVTP